MLELGSESVIEMDGKKWILSRFHIGILHAWRDWIAKQIGDPFATVERLAKYLDKSEMLPRIKDAEAICEQLRGFSMGCPLAKDWLKRESGLAELFKLLLTEHHPNITQGEVFALMCNVGDVDGLEDSLAKVQGSLPNAEAPAAAVSPASPESLTGKTSTAF
jgi:hypothetical protein